MLLIGYKVSVTWYFFQGNCFSRLRKRVGGIEEIKAQRMLSLVFPLCSQLQPIDILSIRLIDCLYAMIINHHWSQEHLWFFLFSGPKQSQHITFQPICLYMPAFLYVFPIWIYLKECLSLLGANLLKTLIYLKDHIWFFYFTINYVNIIT